MKAPGIKFTEENILQMFEKADTFVNEYSKNCKTMILPQLLDLEDKIATAIYYFGEISAEYNKDYSLAYANRVFLKASRIHKAIIEKDMKITMAKEIVDKDMLAERVKEIQASFFAERVDNLLKGLKQIMQAIGRRILYLRDENRTMAIQNGQIK